MDDKLDDILKILQEIAQVLKDNNKNRIESLKKELIQDIYNNALDYLDDSIVYETDCNNHKSNAAGSADNDLEGYYSAKKCDLLTKDNNGITRQHNMIKNKALNETMVKADDNAEMSCFRLDIDYKGHSEQTLDTDPIDIGSIDGPSAAGVRQNEMKNSSSESDGKNLEKQKYTSTNEYDSVDSGSINEPSAVDFTQNEMNNSTSESGERSLTKQQYRSTKQNDSVDGGSINELSAADFMQNELKNSKSESGDRSLTKQQYKSTKQNDSVDSGLINELCAVDVTQINMDNSMENDGTALANQTRRSPQENNSTDKGLLYASSFTDCEKIERMQSSKQSKESLTEDEWKKEGTVGHSNGCTRRQNKTKFSNSDDTRGISNNEKMQGESQPCNGERRTSGSYSGQNKPYSYSNHITAIWLPNQITSRETGCDRRSNAKTAKSEAKPKDMHKQVVEFTKHSHETVNVNTNAIFDGRPIIRQQTDEFTKQPVEKESEIKICLNGKQMRSPLPLFIMRNNISLFTIFGLDYISDRNNRIEITMMLEKFYCVQIAGHLNFNLSNNATFVDLLDCCHFVTNSHNKSLTDWMASYECQVKLLADSSKTLFDQRVQSMYTHALDDDMFTPDDRKGAFLLANQKLDGRKERKKGRSNLYEITISSDEYKSQPCQELVIHKNVSLDSGEFTSYRGRVRFMWSILLELYRLYVFSCILLSIYIEELNADKMRYKIRTLFTQTNVVRAEYFELAMRESARIQVQLTFTHIPTSDNRIPTAVPIYRDGFLHRKDRCR